MSGSLSHIRVLDLSRVLAGPWASQILGDLGADVIKIERPTVGDDTRQWGPPFLTDANGVETKESAYYLSANRNKKSLTVDFTTSEGQSIIRELVLQSDVLLENFKIDGLKQYGLDYASLNSINPQLVYCSITGFGQTGPYASRPGYDLLIQAMSGLMSITGAAETGPQKVGVAVVDILTGLYGTIAVLAALNYREISGRGQFIDLALLDVAIASLANQNMNYLLTGVAPSAMGNAHPNIVPYQDLPTSDGNFIASIGNDVQFARLCVALEIPELLSDPDYGSNAQRVKNREALIAKLKESTIKRSTKELISALEAAGVPCGPVNNLHEVFADPQVIAREMKLDLPHHTAGSVPSVANPIRLSETPVEYRCAPPTLGEDTRKILMDYLGMSQTEIESLASRRIV